MPETTAFPPDRVASGVAIKERYNNRGTSDGNYRPTRIAVFAQGNEGSTYPTTKRRVYSSGDAGLVEGWGSPSHLMLRSLFPQYGDGVGSIPVDLYPLEQPSGGTKASGAVAVLNNATKTQEHYVSVNNILTDRIIAVPGDNPATFATKMVAAINAVLHIPIVATDGSGSFTFELKWAGSSGNNVHIEVISPIDSEFSFTITQPIGGAGVPDISAALAQIGNVWETHIINALDYTDSTELDEYAQFGESRMEPKTHKELKVFTGCNVSDQSTVTAVTDARKTDRTNVILTNPGSNDLPFIIAAEQVREIARKENENPPHDYVTLKCPGLTQGPDSVQWDSDVRDAVVKMGCSTIEVKDGVVEISDVVTCYHPTGEEPPGFRYVVDFAKRGTLVNDLDLEYNGPKWLGKILIPDNQVSDNPDARKPKDGLAALYAIIEKRSKGGFISDPEYAYKNSFCNISSVNPKRLNVLLADKLSGNCNVISIDHEFGFYYGGQ